ncbi:hypothetical protein CTI12_AA413010 [Artemisia annua]|uniref:COI1 F-box domain-containing protein n=1 Tax=Artemisia annua TaxID=35608 RepID=A0A2U1M6N3_ARTAN|nr:hypothetical protein CTI12_AA413010 [Artemisia annua]
MEQVFNCVIPYIDNVDDRNSISLVSRTLYKLDSLTRKHVTFHAHYAPNPSRVSERFPFIESLTLKGAPHKDFAHVLNIDITPWIVEISVKFKLLKALHIRGMVVGDEDLELLVRTRGKDLRSLRIHKCGLFSEDGLMYVSSYCNELRTLCLENNTLVDVVGDTDSDANGEWLRELAMRNMVIETFHCENPFGRYDVKDVTLLVKNSCNSLVSLKICPHLLIGDLGDVFSHAKKLEYFDGVYFDENGDYSSFKFPLNISGLCIYGLPETSFPILLPYVNQLRELKDFNYRICQCFLFESCPNLEVIETMEICGDTGLQVIGLFCKKLRKLTYGSRVTHVGLIALAQGCYNLEYLHVRLIDIRHISNETLECIGTHLKNLRDFRMNLLMKDIITDLPLDNGIRAMLTGCSKLQRLHISVCQGGLTDMGLGYIGKYGHNLRSLFLGCTGESDAGLLELSKGCPKLRKLKLTDCPFNEEAIANFVFNIHSLRYIWVKRGHRTVLALTRPTVPAEVLAILKPYIILTEKLHRLAVQLAVDGSGVGLVKMTCTSSRATDALDTRLVSAMVAKGTRINEERVLLDRPSEKPLKITKVQIANAESRFATAISESGEIVVEGRVKDGVPHLTKVGAFEVNHYTKKQAVMVIGVDEKPSKEALKKIDEIPAVEECVFLLWQVFASVMVAAHECYLVYAPIVLEAMFLATYLGLEHWGQQIWRAVAAKALRKKNVAVCPGLEQVTHYTSIRIDFVIYTCFFELHEVHRCLGQDVDVADENSEGDGNLTRAAVILNSLVWDDRPQGEARVKMKDWQRGAVVRVGILDRHVMRSPTQVMANGRVVAPVRGLLEIKGMLFLFSSILQAFTRTVMFGEYVWRGKGTKGIECRGPSPSR